jgi:hypothetical protein
MQDVNPDKPYSYCYFHGWNFTHKGLLCKKMRQAFDMDKLHAVNPTSTTPHGNASVEPAYKSWLWGRAYSALQHCPPAVPQRVVSFGPTTTVTIDELDSDSPTPSTTYDHVPTTALPIHPDTPPLTALTITNAALSAEPPTSTPPPLPFSGSTNHTRAESLTRRISDLEAELTAALAYHAANPT